MSTDKIKVELDELVKFISAKTGIGIVFYGEDDGKYIYDVQIGLSSISFSYNTGIYSLVLTHSDESLMYPPVRGKNIKTFANNAVKLIEKAIKEYKYDNRLYLEDIANKIEKATGMSWNYVGEDNNSLTIDFNYNVSYMKNLGGKGLQFILALDEESKNVVNIVDKDESIFIKRVVSEYNKATGKGTRTNKYYTKTTPNKDITNIVKELVNNKETGTLRLYKDNCWWSDIEFASNGNYRFWVGYEDKRTGRTKGSIFTIYDLDTRKYGCGIVVKKAVVDKIFSTARALKRAGII